MIMNNLIERDGVPGAACVGIANNMFQKAAAPAFGGRNTVVAGETRLPLLVHHDDELYHGR
jgi:hypothetical protein